MHACRQSENPRHTGRCACGQQLPEPANTLRRRHPEIEAQIVREAALKAGVNGEPFLEHMQTRSLAGGTEYVDDPMMLRDGVNWTREGSEEASDGGNNCVWDLIVSPDAPGADCVFMALQAFAMAHHYLREAREARR